MSRLKRLAVARPNRRGATPISINELSSMNRDETMPDLAVRTNIINLDDVTLCSHRGCIFFNYFTGCDAASIVKGNKNAPVRE